MSADTRKGYLTLTQIPQPMHNDSEMNEILSDDVTSIHSLPETDIKTEEYYHNNSITEHNIKQ